MKKSFKYHIIVLLALLASFHFTYVIGEPDCNLEYEISPNENVNIPLEIHVEIIPDSAAPMPSQPIPEIVPIRVYKYKTVTMDKNATDSSSKDPSIFAFTLELFAHLFDYIF